MRKLYAYGPTFEGKNVFPGIDNKVLLRLWPPITRLLVLSTGSGTGCVRRWDGAHKTGTERGRNASLCLRRGAYRHGTERGSTDAARNERCFRMPQFCFKSDDCDVLVTLLLR